MPLLHAIPPWAVMWLLALALYAAGKCASLAAANFHAVPLGRRFAFLLLFPGMNARAFCSGKMNSRPPTRPAAPFLANVVAGAALLWGFARLVPPQHPQIAGWIGMIGLILMLHFGLLQLVSLAWQAAGLDAPLLMNEPYRAGSVTEFWSVRWNTAYRWLSHRFLFTPLARRLGRVPALLLTFGISGLVHDLVISVPAGAGYGLPTAYFLLQALGVLYERSRAGKAALAGHIRARCFTILIVAAPAPLLFHPPFVLRVIVPFMTALGALPREAFT